ncbi:MAG: DUF362 domain-containing protein [candidate division KSB1 bacterium]|nr:DUF362 domain-containing protein [candidate division KSB1 bacterium]
MKRRAFIKAIGAGAAWASIPFFRSQAEPLGQFFRLNPLIEALPDAVFIMRTQISDKHDEAAKYKAGRKFASTVFIEASADDGLPVTRKIVLKPNLTSRGKWQRGYTIERSMGVVTDALFVEGLIDGIKPLGLGGDRFFIREVNGIENLTEGGYGALAARTGADVRIISTPVDSLSPDQVVWKDVPEGIWFKKIPYLWPVNAPDTFLINIAKFKSHGMGMTLCAKNLQGTIAANYQQHCTLLQNEMSIDPAHVQPNAKKTIQNNYQRHVAAGIPRWDRPGADGGLWQETWATRCLDNNSILKADLHIIEALYGHDGNFIEGPHDGFAADFMTNLIIFGKNPFHVDIIGTWLAGHEPGNFGLFHMAVERGMSSFLDPFAVPLYEWFEDGKVEVKSLTSLERTPLVTYYLRRDYNGQSEPLWHLVNEPYDYSKSAVTQNEKRPAAFALSPAFPNPFNSNTSLVASLPHTGHFDAKVYNLSGQLIDILVDGRLEGQHVIRWNADDKPSGIYFLKASFNGQTISRRLFLLR